MSKNLLNVQSFQQSQELLSAINTLSIHRKLNLNGYPDLNRKDAAEQSQETLIAFFQKLDKIAQDIEDRHPKHVLGVNVRFAPSGGKLRPSKTQPSFIEFSTWGTFSFSSRSIV